MSPVAGTDERPVLKPRVHKRPPPDIDRMGHTAGGVARLYWRSLWETLRDKRGLALANFIVVALGTVIATALAAVSPTPVTDPPLDADEAIAVALETQPNAFVDTPAVPEGQIFAEAGTISAPAVGDDDFVIELETDELNELGEAVSSEHDGVAIAVHDEGDGAFRALLHIADEDAPLEHRFVIGDAFDLQPLEDGGITVWNADGDLAGVIAAPWAVDANGVSVPTTYEVDGNTLIQRVYPAPTTAFPVVADPIWIPVLMIAGHLTRHALTRMAQRGVSQALVQQVINNGARTAGNKGTLIFTQGRGANQIRVIVDKKTGNIITVTKGGS